MTESRHEEIRLLYQQAGGCLEKGDFAGALTRLQRAMELVPRSALTARAIMLNNIGHAQVSLNRYQDALCSFQGAADLYREAGNAIGAGEQMGNVGSVFRDQEKWEDSIDAYAEALAIFREASHERGVADQYSNLAYSYARKGDAEKAQRHFESAKNLYDLLGDTEKSQLCETNLLNLSVHAGRGIQGHEGA